MITIEFKINVIDHCKAVLKERIDLLVKDLEFLNADIAEDTKSSAGDKYETSREMANLEKQKLASQLALNKKSLGFITNLKPNSPNEIQSGSLVETDKTIIYIGISLGLQEVEGQQVVIISPNAPLGQALLGKKIEDRVNFNQQSYQVLKVV